MKTIEERAKEWGEHIFETTPYDVVDGKACVFVEDRNIADVAEESYIAGATEQKAIDDAELLKLKSSLENEGNIVVPQWFLEIVENTLRIQNNINEPVRKALGESSHDRNIRQSLNVLRKLLNGEELSGMERFEKLK